MGSELPRWSDLLTESLLPARPVFPSFAASAVRPDRRPSLPLAPPLRIAVHYLDDLECCARPYPTKRDRVPRLPAPLACFASPPWDHAFAPPQDVRYLKPYVEEVETELAERNAYDNATRL